MINYNNLEILSNLEKRFNFLEKQIISHKDKSNLMINEFNLKIQVLENKNQKLQNEIIEINNNVIKKKDEEMQLLNTSIKELK